jgi:hypothetical protein
MKLFLALLAVALLLRLLVFWLRGDEGRRWLRSFKKYPAPHQTYLDLHNRALRTPRAELGFFPAATPSQPWAVIMDWGVENGLATVVAFSDGTASIYTGSGGGSIGGQAHESIRHAAHTAVNLAAEILPRAHMTNYFPLPKRGKVFFYFRTNSGVFTARAREKPLREQRHPLSPLANAMHDVVTEYRLLQQSDAPPQP